MQYAEYGWNNRMESNKSPVKISTNYYLIFRSKTLFIWHMFTVHFRYIFKVSSYPMRNQIQKLSWFILYMFEFFMWIRWRGREVVNLFKKPDLQFSNYSKVLLYLGVYVLCVCVLAGRELCFALRKNHLGKIWKILWIALNFFHISWKTPGPLTVHYAKTSKNVPAGIMSQSAMVLTLVFQCQATSTLWSLVSSDGRCFLILCHRKWSSS